MRPARFDFQKVGMRFSGYIRFVPVFDIRAVSCFAENSKQ